MISHPPFDNDEFLEILRQKLLTIPGFKEPRNMKGYYGITLDLIERDLEFAKCLDVLTWIFQCLKNPAIT